MKALKGRRHHIIVDTLNLLSAVVVHRADLNERRGTSFVVTHLNKARVGFPGLKVVLADSGYSGEFEVCVKKTYKWLLEIIRKPVGTKRLALLLKRTLGEGLRSHDSTGHCTYNDSNILTFRRSLNLAKI